MGTRISTQAKAVLNVLAEKRCHLTADEILSCLDNIGTATVYRALDHLTELGMIRRLALGKKSAVYEYVRDSHVHFVCNRCGKACYRPGGEQCDGTGIRSHYRIENEMRRQ